MKKLRLLLFILFVGLLFNMSASAASYKFTCEYESTSDSNDKYYLTYQTNGNQIKVLKYEHRTVLSDFEFNANGNSFKDDKCPSSFDIGDGFSIIWKEDYQGQHKYISDSKKIVEDELSEFFDIDTDYSSMDLFEKEEVFNRILQHNKLTFPGETGQSLASYTGLWEKIIFNEYTCDYAWEGRLTYRLTFVNPALSIGDSSVSYMLLLGVSSVNDHEGLGFYTNGNYSKNSNSCPSSFDIEGSLITWKKQYGGEYRYTGIRTESEPMISGCLQNTEKNSCLTDRDFACLWIENKDSFGSQGGYCNVDNLLYVSCGDAIDIPVEVPVLISFFVNLLKIATPIILIFVSIITLLKSLAAQKDDEIKKAQSSLVKKIIASALVFFVVAIVQFVISKVATNEEYESFSNCLNCFLNNNCKSNMYYKTMSYNEEYCTFINSGVSIKCKNLSESKRINLLKHEFLWTYLSDGRKGYYLELTFDSLKNVEKIELQFFDRTTGNHLLSETLKIHESYNQATSKLGWNPDTEKSYSDYNYKLKVFYDDGQHEFFEMYTSLNSHYPYNF